MSSTGHNVLCAGRPGYTVTAAWRIRSGCRQRGVPKVRQCRTRQALLGGTLTRLLRRCADDAYVAASSELVEVRGARSPWQDNVGETERRVSVAVLTVSVCREDRIG